MWQQKNSLVVCKINGQWKLIKLPKDIDLTETKQLGLTFWYNDDIFIDHFKVIRKGSLDVFIAEIQTKFQEYMTLSSMIQNINELDTYGNWLRSAEVYKLEDPVSETV